MGVPGAGRWSWAKGLKGWGGGIQGEKRGPSEDLQSPPPHPHPIPTPPPLGVCTWKGARAPRSHSARGARFWSSGTLGARDQLPQGRLTPAAPPALPALRGQLCGAGELLHCVSQGRRWGRRGPRRPRPSPAVRPQPSPHGSLSLNVLQRRPPPTPTPSLRFPGSFAARSPASPTPRGAAHTRPVRMHGVRARGAGPGTLSHVPLATGTAQRQRPFTEPPRTLP